MNYHSVLTLFTDLRCTTIFIQDMDGLCSREVGGQLMCAYRELGSIRYHYDVPRHQLAEQTDKMAIEAGMYDI